MHWYWDGLFATNPPFSEFVRGTKDWGYSDKPDVVVLLQINPTRKPALPTFYWEQVDRRNELAGNLTLEQERAANRWMVRPGGPRPMKRQSSRFRWWVSSRGSIY